MSTLTLFTRTPDLGPILVSDLPPGVSIRPSLFARFRADLTASRNGRSFERAMRSAGHNEQGDLLAAHRRG